MILVYPCVCVILCETFIGPSHLPRWMPPIAADCFIGYCCKVSFDNGVGWRQGLARFPPGGARHLRLVSGYSSDSGYDNTGSSRGCGLKQRRARVSLVLPECRLLTHGATCLQRRVLSETCLLMHRVAIISSRLVARTAALLTLLLFLFAVDACYAGGVLHCIVLHCTVLRE